MSNKDGSLSMPILDATLMDKIDQIPYFQNNNNIFNSSTFNLIAYLNKKIPSSEHLGEIEKLNKSIKREVRFINERIQLAIHEHGLQSGEKQQELVNNLNELIEAKKLILKLSEYIQNMIKSSMTTKKKLKSITKETQIYEKKLQNLKKVHKFLKVIVLAERALEGINEYLNVGDGNRDYIVLADRAQMLSQFVTTFSPFDSYSHFEKIKRLHDQCMATFEKMYDIIFEDFEDIAKIEYYVEDSDISDSDEEEEEMTPAQKAGEAKLKQLEQASLVVNAMGKNKRDLFMRHIINSELDEFERLFQRKSRGGYMETLSKRYTALRRFFIHFDRKYDGRFPSHWKITKEFMTEFMVSVGNTLVKIFIAYENVEKAPNDKEEKKVNLDPQVLYQALRASIKFELKISNQFSENPNEIRDEIQKLQEKLDKFTLILEKDPTNIEKQGKVEALQKKINYLVNQLNEFKGNLNNYQLKNLIVIHFKRVMDIYIEFEDRNMKSKVDEIIANEKLEYGKMVHSGQDLFIYISESFRNCRICNTEETLYAVANGWKKHINTYCEKMIQKLPKIVLHKPARGLKSLFSDKIPTLSEEAILQISQLVQITEYCHEEMDQTEEIVLSVIAEEYRTKLHFEAEKSQFYRITKLAVEYTVNSVVNKLVPHFIVFSKSLHAEVEKEWSLPVAEALDTHFGNIARYFPTSHFVTLCKHVVPAVLKMFELYLFKCKSISSSDAKHIQEKLEPLYDSLKRLLHHSSKNEEFIKLTAAGKEVIDEDDSDSFQARLRLHKKETDAYLCLLQKHDDSVLKSYLEAFPRKHARDDLQRVLELKPSLSKSKMNMILDMYDSETQQHNLRSYSPPQHDLKFKGGA